MKNNGLFSLMFALAILTISISSISAVVTEPMVFRGEVTHSNGTAIPNGYFIVAEIEGVISGECEIIDGIYSPCIVESHVLNKDIYFFIGDVEIGTYPFEEKEFPFLDFIIDDLPPRDENQMSNGVCEPEKGECSYNLLDCDRVITNACEGNGVCDTAIGETCEFTPSDCGACPTSGSGGSSGGGGGSSGGGGGGGSSSSSSSSSTGTTSNTENGLTFETEQFEEEAEEESTETQTEAGEERIRFGAKITGAVVGFSKKTAGKVVGIIILIIVILAILLLVSHLRNNNVKSKKAGMAAMKTNGSKKKSAKKKTKSGSTKSKPVSTQSAKLKKKVSKKK